MGERGATGVMIGMGAVGYQEKGTIRQGGGEGGEEQEGEGEKGTIRQGGGG